MRSAPGPIAHRGAAAPPGGARGRAAGSPAEEALRRYAETPLGRMATADEVAGAAIFLASELSGGITGQLIPVDAGLAS